MTKKNTEYTIIDHVGSIDESRIGEAYKMAYSICRFNKDMTFTLSKIIKLFSHHTLEISQKQKTMMRFQRNPEQVIVICTSLNFDKFVLDTWAEKTNDFHIILVENGTSKPEHLTLKDYRPELFEISNSTNSKYRRCANIWSRALGWTFSAPLYRDEFGGVNENFHKRPDWKEMSNRSENAGHFTKISVNPTTFINSKRTATESECKEFYEYYCYLYKNNLLNEFLESGYTICTECGRPVRLDTVCDFCDTITTTEFIEPDFDIYYDQVENSNC